MAELWRRTLERQRTAFEAMRDPRFAAAVSFEPESNVGAFPADGRNRATSTGYAIPLDSLQMSIPGGFGFIDAFADNSPEEPPRIPATGDYSYRGSDAVARRHWRRFCEDAERASRAVAEAPEWLRDAYAIGTADAAGWLALLFQSAWADGTAERVACGPSSGDSDCRHWFSFLPDLAAASVELIDAILAAEKPGVSSNSKGGRPREYPSDPLCFEAWEAYRAEVTNPRIGDAFADYCLKHERFSSLVEVEGLEAKDIHAGWVRVTDRRRNKTPAAKTKRKTTRK